MSMSIGSSLTIALRALSRNKLQTALTTVGMTIGVATVLTMIALGTGAEAAIEQQVRAAGMNLIVVTAGNYKAKTEDDGGGVVDHQARLNSQFTIGRNPQSTIRHDDVVLAGFHPEDDPMEKHDHPTARQRLGDVEAGLGAAATLTPADADAIRQLRGVQFVSEGIHENVHASAGDRKWFTRLHGGDVELPSIRRSWTFTAGRFFTAREQSRLAPVAVLGAFAAEKLFGDANPVGREILLWKQPFRVVGVVGSGSWMVAPAAGDDQFDAVYVLPALLEAGCQIIGRPFKLSSLHARTLRPHSPMSELHVDVRRDSMDWPLAGFILMIDEFRTDNGATRFVPGSHRWPNDPEAVMPDRRAGHDGQVLACGPAGSLLVFNGSAWHGHTANASGGPRRSLQGAFIPRDGRAGTDFSARMRPETLARLAPLARYVLAV
jgi:hypothetical protein